MNCHRRSARPTDAPQRTTTTTRTRPHDRGHDDHPRRPARATAAVEGFGGRGRGGGGRSQANRGDIRAAVLALLTEQPMHGYQIIQELAERTGGAWQPSAGSVYPSLQLLADEGLIAGTDNDGRKVFALTAGRHGRGPRKPPEKRRRGSDWRRPPDRSIYGTRWRASSMQQSKWRPPAPPIRSHGPTRSSPTPANGSINCWPSKSLSTARRPAGSDPVSPGGPRARV